MLRRGEAGRACHGFRARGAGGVPRVSSRQAFARSREKVPGGRMRGASEAKHAFDLALPEKRKSSSLRSRPHPALRATFSRFAGEGLEPAFRVTGSVRSALRPPARPPRSEEHTSELQSLMRTSYAAFCLTKKIHNN